MIELQLVAVRQRIEALTLIDQIEKQDYAKDFIDRNHLTTTTEAGTSNDLGDNMQTIKSNIYNDDATIKDIKIAYDDVCCEMEKIRAEKTLLNCEVNKIEEKVTLINEKLDALGFYHDTLLTIIRSFNELRQNKNNQNQEELENDNN